MANPQRCGADTTSITYQGRLNNGGTPADGDYDFTFGLYLSNSGGVPTAPVVTNSSVTVSNGLFTTSLDFGAAFTGSNYWLEIGVRKAGGGTDFVVLSTRQQLTASPQAIYASSAGSVTGTLSVTNIPPGVALLDSSPAFSGTVSASALQGDGAGITNLNAAQLTTGMVADALLSANVALLNSSPNFIGTVSAGALRGDGSGVTNLDASRITTGTLADALLSTNVAFLNSSASFTGTVSAAALRGDGSGVTNLSASQVTTGTMADALLSANVAMLNSSPSFTGTVSAGALRGDGSGVTNLNASQVATGTMADARLSANVALLNSSPIFTGTVSAGALRGDGYGITNLNASQIITGSISDALLSANVALLNSSPSFTGTVSADALRGEGSGITNLNASRITTGFVADGFLSTNVALLNSSPSFTGTVSAVALRGDGSGITNLNASRIITGTVDDSLLSANVALLNSSPGFSGTVSAGALRGDGSGVTNLNASRITTGTVADAFLSTNVALLNSSPNFTGTVSAVALRGDGSSVTNLNASRVTTGTLADARLSANVALLNSSPSFTGTVSAVALRGDGSGITNLNASRVTTGTVPDTVLSTNVALLNATQTFTGLNTFKSRLHATASTAAVSIAHPNGTWYYSLGNGGWFENSVAYVQPSVSGRFAFDVMPKGSAASTWIDVCDTDVTLNNAVNGEWLHLGKEASSYASVSSFANGTGQIRPLVLQEDGGIVGIATTSPEVALHVNGQSTAIPVHITSSTSPGILFDNALIAQNSTAYGSIGVATGSGQFLSLSGLGDLCVAGASRVVLGTGVGTSTAGLAQFLLSSNKLVITNVSIYVETNVAPFTIDTTDLVVNKFYTNSNRRLNVTASIGLDAGSVAALYIGRDSGGNWASKIPVSTSAPQGATNVIAGWVQPLAIYCITNLSSSTVGVVSGSCQRVWQ